MAVSVVDAARASLGVARLPARSARRLLRSMIMVNLPPTF
jgi:DNA-binding transcriptional LysR family regulator